MSEERHDAPSGDLVTGSDGRMRCWWAGGSAGLARYHDHEWGRGSREEQALFERLSLEAFQAGLSWRTVLERRDALREAFAGFDPLTVATFGASDVERLLGDVRLIRNRAKVTAVVANARLLTALHAQGVLLRGLTDEAVASGTEGHRLPPRRRSDVPARSAASTALARDLQRRGWRFIGPTTAYAYLQAAGWVDDHLLGCHARGLR